MPGRHVIAVGIRAHAPGRVNLIGDHTDYMGGLVLPMAIDCGITVEGTVTHGVVELRSDADPEPARIDLPCADPTAVTPRWGRYVAAVAAELATTRGLVGTVSSDLPVGMGLSSSAALEVAVALALGADPDDPTGLALLCQRAEHLATGVPTGIMDQLVIAAGRAGHALMIDCATLEHRAVPLPPEAAVWIVDSGEARTLEGSAYAERRAAAEAAATVLGALPAADPAAIEALEDPVMRRRARHVRSECDRVRLCAAALEVGDLAAAGAAMVASHASLRDDYEVSTPTLDALVDRLVTTAGVYGARLTGAGFGGAVVALAAHGVELPGRRVRAADGASVGRAP